MKKQKYNFQESGIHSQPFYIVMNFNFSDVLARATHNYENIKYDTSYIRHFCLVDEQRILEDEVYHNEILSKTHKDFLETIYAIRTFFSALAYVPEAALRCSFVLFEFFDSEAETTHYLIPDTDFSRATMKVRLDAYQALTVGSIDEKSALFTDREYFEQVLGKELTQDVIQAITKK